jgi:hypothetical protein
MFDPLDTLNEAHVPSPAGGLTTRLWQSLSPIPAIAKKLARIPGAATFQRLTGLAAEASTERPGGFLAWVRSPSIETEAGASLSPCPASLTLLPCTPDTRSTREHTPLAPPRCIDDDTAPTVMRSPEPAPHCPYCPCGRTDLFVAPWNGAMHLGCPCGMAWLLSERPPWCTWGAPPSPDLDAANGQASEHGLSLTASAHLELLETVSHLQADIARLRAEATYAQPIVPCFGIGALTSIPSTEQTLQSLFHLHVSDVVGCVGAAPAVAVDSDARLDLYRATEGTGSELHAAVVYHRTDVANTSHSDAKPIVPCFGIGALASIPSTEQTLQSLSHLHVSDVVGCVGAAPAVATDCDARPPVAVITGSALSNLRENLRLHDCVTAGQWAQLDGRQLFATVITTAAPRACRGVSFAPLRFAEGTQTDPRVLCRALSKGTQTPPAPDAAIEPQFDLWAFHPHPIFCVPVGEYDIDDPLNENFYWNFSATFPRLLLRCHASMPHHPADSFAALLAYNKALRYVCQASSTRISSDVYALAVAALCLCARTLKHPELAYLSASLKEHADWGEYCAEDDEYDDDDPRRYPDPLPCSPPTPADIAPFLGVDTSPPRHLHDRVVVGFPGWSEFRRGNAPLRPRGTPLRSRPADRASPVTRSTGGFDPEDVTDDDEELASEHDEELVSEHVSRKTGWSDGDFRSPECVGCEYRPVGDHGADAGENDGADGRAVTMTSGDADAGPL